MKKLFAMLLALCMMCGAMSVGAEAATQEVTIGRATFQIPAETVISESYEYAMIAAIGDTELSIMVEDWASYGMDLGSSGVRQWLNVYCFYLRAGADEDTASLIAGAHTEEDIGMPDKAAVAHSVYDNGEQAELSIFHAFDDYGFAIIVDAPTGTDLQALLDMGKEIALSFRLDGMTAEEMTAAAEEASALAAAQKYVVITNSSANIRSGPDGNAAKLTTAKQGDTFPLIGEDGNWYIIDVNGQTGYVTKSLSAIKD